MAELSVARKTILKAAVVAKRWLLKYPPDFDAASIQVIEKVRGRTMTSPERIIALLQAVRYIERARIPGSIVECGVWRGGSMMASAFALLELGSKDRDLYLFDTFDGMCPPTDEDVRHDGAGANKKFSMLQTGSGNADWCRAPLDDVQRGMRETGYPEERVHYVKGKVETTLETQAPPKIALLRLDTDFYESTKCSLLHLYPKLAPGGILVIDDYGHWQGAKKAVDEYFQDNPVFLARVDYTARVLTKPLGAFHA